MHQYHERDREEDRKQGGKTLVKRYGKCGVKGGGRNGQNKVGKLYSMPFRRPQIIGKARGEE